MNLYASLRPLIPPAQRILAKLLAALPATELLQAGWRDRLLPAAEALVCAEAPEARLIASDQRQAFLRELLAQMMPPRQNLAALEDVSPELAGLAEAPASVEPGQLEATGFRGFTVRINPNGTAAQASAALHALLGDKFSMEVFPSLPGYWSVFLTGDHKPLVSEAWEIARKIAQTPPFDYAEPNLAIPAFPAPDSAALESFGGPGDWDTRHPSALANCEWALDRCRIKEVWNDAKRGAGVVIGHIDTGYTLHPELKPNLDRLRDWDFWEGDADAQDPLEDGWWDKWRAKSPVLNPGHGTGTGSVIASPEGKQATTVGTGWVSGSAPAATLIPYRATPTVVILPFGSQDEVARAIAKAADDGVHVISMSLGSPWDSQVLRDAVQHALDAGVIVCAAAGNIVQEWAQGTGVTFPARYDGVIAVAGCDYDYNPWRYSCRGPEVDITAGGTDVWRAVATNDLNNAIAEPGSGTSFAVAAVAGVAACWLGLHGGPQAVRDYYKGEARLIPAAFLYCLRQHKKTPLAQGDPALFGGGVLDAAELAKVKLPSPGDLQPLLQPLAAPNALASLALLAPADTSAETAENTLHAWLDGAADQLDPQDIREIGTHIATNPTLLAHWQAANAAANPLAPNFSAFAEQAPPAYASALALGLSPTVQGKVGQPASTTAMARLQTKTEEVRSFTAETRRRAPLGPQAAVAHALAAEAPAPQPLKSVIAYVLHETEQAEAFVAMDPNQPGKAGRITPEVTQCFVLGQATEQEIAALREKNLFVRELPVPTPPAAEHFRAATLQAFGAAEQAAPHHFLMTLHGPLTEERRKMLEQTYQITLLELVGRDVYRILATPDKTQDIQDFDYVTSVIAERVVPPASLQALGVAPAAESMDTSAAILAPELPQLHDLWLRDGVDVAAFVARLTALHYQVEGTAGQKVRVWAVPDSAESQALKAMPETGGQVELYISPELHLDHARSIIGLAPAGTPARPFPWTGEGELIGIADSGIDQKHPDLQKRIHTVVALGRPNATDDPLGHGTHVAGAAVGDGTASNGSIQGAAPGAKIYFQSILGAPTISQQYPLKFPIALSDLFDPAYQAGARIHNNSWGAMATSFYRMSSREVDDYVSKHPDMLVVISAGNEGTTASPAPPRQRRSSAGAIDWYSLGAPATSKNALTVGASQSDITTGGAAAMTYNQFNSNQFPLANVPGDVAGLKMSGDPEDLACFSSRGPTEALQIKPDLVAPGTDIVSARSAIAAVGRFTGIYAANLQYAHMSGTSMAAPIVSGCAALVREYYAKARGCKTPSAALIKATLINGTRQLAGAQASAPAGGFPNGHQGFGRIDMRNTLPDPAQPEFELFYYDTWQGMGQPLAMDQRQRFVFQLPAALPWLRICLTYTDPPASKVQNNLVLMLHNQNTNTKWYGNERQQTTIAQVLPAPDSVNNVLIIRVENPQPGKYFLGVLTGNVPFGPQHFALVITAPNLPTVETRQLNG